MPTRLGTKIIVFTDIHFTAENRAGRPDPDASLALGIAHVNHYHSDADLVVFSGDLTHHGDAASYAKLKARLADLKLPYHLLIGNHDNRDTFRAAFPDAAGDPNGFVQAVIDLPGARLITLDTLFAPPYDYPAAHAGTLCGARLAWLEDQLATPSAKPTVIIMHHPPHDTGFEAMDSIKLRNGPAFYDALARHAPVRHLVCGHIHRTISGSHRGLPFSIFKSTVGQMPMLFEGTNTAVENDEPAAYGIVFINEDGVLAHTEDYALNPLTTPA